MLGINSSVSVELRHPAADQLVRGVEVSLRCQVEGHPEPSVEWYRNRIRCERLPYYLNHTQFSSIYSVFTVFCCSRES